MNQPAGRRRRLPIAERREQVLDAAMRLIVRDGYAGVSMEAIAREAGVAKTVVYAAYPDRGQLLWALLEREEAAAYAQLARAMPPRALGDGAGPSLLAWVTSLAEALLETPDRWRLMLLPAEGTPPEVRERVDAGRELAYQQVRSVVDELLAGPSLPGTIDRELAARAVLAVAEDGAKRLLDDPDRYPPARLVEFAVAVGAALGITPGSR